MQNKHVHAVLAGALFLLVFVLLFSFRSIDDNGLFSWSWLFARTDASQIYLLLVAALITAFFLSRRSFPEQYDAVLLGVVPFLAVLPFWYEPEIIVDASRYFTQAKHLELYGIVFFFREWGRAIFAWTDLPAIPFLFGLLFRLFGESRMVIQAFTSLLFSLTVVLTYRIGRTLWDRDTGRAAGMLLLGIPYLLTQVPLVMVDVATMFLFTLSLSAFLDALKHGGTARIAGAVIAIVLFVFSKYSAWFMLSVLGVALIALRDSRGIRRGMIILMTAGVIAGVLLLLMVDVVAAQVNLLLEYQGPGLARWGESHLSTFLFHIHPFITVSALASLVLAIRRRDAPYAVVLWLILLVLLFGIRRIRYILPVFPLLTLMAGYGLQAVRQADLRRFIILSIVATSLVIAAGAYLPFARTMSAVNLQHAGRYLDTLAADTVRVVTPDAKDPVVAPAVSVPLLDLHTRKHIRYGRGNSTLPPSDVIDRSPLRFTWEYGDPAYYDRSGNADGVDLPVVVIGDVSDPSLPPSVEKALPGYRLSASFQTTEGVFRYAVGVRVYQSDRSPSGR